MPKMSFKDGGSKYVIILHDGDSIVYKDNIELGLLSREPVSEEDAKLLIATETFDNYNYRPFRH